MKKRTYSLFAATRAGVKTCGQIVTILFKVSNARGHTVTAIVNASLQIVSHVFVVTMGAAASRQPIPQTGESPRRLQS